MGFLKNCLHKIYCSSILKNKIKFGLRNSFVTHADWFCIKLPSVLTVFPKGISEPRSRLLIGALYWLYKITFTKNVGEYFSIIFEIEKYAVNMILQIPRILSKRNRFDNTKIVMLDILCVRLCGFGCSNGGDRWNFASQAGALLARHVSKLISAIELHSTRQVSSK